MDLKSLQVSQQAALAALLVCMVTVAWSCRQQIAEAHDSWRVAGGGPGGGHYSSLNEIDTTNVGQLAVAWVYHTGDADTSRNSQMQCNPIVIDSLVFVTTPQLRLQALHAGSGQLVWSFDPDSANRNTESFHFILNNNRGVTYWSDGAGDERILYAAGAHIYAVQARTGRLITDFADSGRLSLHRGLPPMAQSLFVTATSPGVVYGDLYIIGSRVDEGPAAAPGYIRAFDVRTGELRWKFHTIPLPGEPGHETWDDPDAWQFIGGANSWAGMTLEEKRGILFAPTGSASFDFYGGRRLGDNLYANCLLALDAATGKLRWHYQVIRHDLWDWDLPTAPVLMTIRRNGKPVDVVAQPTKHGMLFVFEREAGRPVFPIEEMPVDSISPLAGERLSPRQPVVRWPEPFVRQVFTEDELNPYLPDTTLQRLRRDLAGYRYGRMFIPPGLQTAIQLPGLDGGAEWGGPGADPKTGWIYINANEAAWKMTMVERKPQQPVNENWAAAGKRLYERHCRSCHGADRKGFGHYPSIENAHQLYTQQELLGLLMTGRRMMPAFSHLQEEEREALAAFIANDAAAGRKPFTAKPSRLDSMRDLPYALTGYAKFLSADGRPAIKPPWGTLTAIDLNSGERRWQVPLGEDSLLKARGLGMTGTENYGGPVITAGGLLFIAATPDRKMRAFHKRTGELLWEYELPAAGFATPATYSYRGRQYLLIACGGGKLGARSGDAYMAFALPGKP